MKRFIVFVLLFTSVGYAGEMNSVKIGESAPAFALKNYDGKEFTLQQLLKENRLVVVMFIATQCPVSNAYNERMEKLNDTYIKKGVTFVGVNSNIKETVAEIAAHSKVHGFTFPVLKDEQNKVADAYGAQVTPETYVINPEGKLLYHGRIDDSRNAEKAQSQDLALAIDALLAGKEVPRAETKAFGCSIKRAVAN